jgi:hypothetical protein
MFHFTQKNSYDEHKIEVRLCIYGFRCIVVPTNMLLKKIDLHKKFLGPQRILALQEQLLG